MSEYLPLGLILVDDLEHVVTGKYKPHTNEDDPTAVEVIEIPNMRLAHTRVEGGNPEGRIAVFSRLISQTELHLRNTYHESYPEQYKKRIIEDLPK